LLLVAVFIFNHAVFDYTIYVEVIITTYGSCSATFASLKRHAFNFKLRVRVLIGYLFFRSLAANIGAMLIILVVFVLYPDKLSSGLFKNIPWIYLTSFSLGVLLGLLSVRYGDIRLYGGYLMSCASLLIYTQQSEALVWASQHHLNSLWILLLPFASLAIDRLFYRVTEDY